MSIYKKFSNDVCSIKNNFKYKNEGTAFGHFVIRECLGKILELGYDGIDIDSYIFDHIVDGSYDCGNDAILVDKDTSTINIFQFKYSEESLLTIEDLEKNKSFLNTILRLDGPTVFPNNKIKELIRTEIDNILTIDNLDNKSYEIVLWYIDNHFNDSISKSINELKKYYTDKNIPIKTMLYDYETLHSLYLDTDLPNNNTSLSIISNEFFLRKSKFYNNNKAVPIETLVASIKASSLKNAVLKYRESLFALNVRYFKGLKKINIDIKDELLKGSKSNFWMLNNGIIAICKNFELSDTQSEIYIDNLQIVNGGQTSQTIATIDSLDDNIDVLIRLTKIKSKDGGLNKISKNISIASNSQNAIQTRDLRSGDKIQLEIYDKLRSVHIFYDKKDGEWSNLTKDEKNFFKNPNTKKIIKIKNITLATAYMSLFLQLPATGKGRKTLAFSDNYYSEIFSNCPNGIDNQFYKLMFSLRLAEFISNTIENMKAKKKPHHCIYETMSKDTILSLAALYFCRNSLSVDYTKDDVTKLVNKERDWGKFLNHEDGYSLKHISDLEKFILELIEHLETHVELQEGISESNNEIFNLTNYLKTDSSYPKILRHTIKNLLK